MIALAILLITGMLVAAAMGAWHDDADKEETAAGRYEEADRHSHQANKACLVTFLMGGLALLVLIGLGAGA